MLFSKYWKNPRKLKILLLLMIITLIVLTLLLINNGLQHTSNNQPYNHEHLIDERLAARLYTGDNNNQMFNVEKTVEIIRSVEHENGIIQPEKYDEQKIKTRLINEKIEHLKEHSKNNAIEPEEEHTILDAVTMAIHIFYTVPVQWHKNNKKPLLTQMLYKLNNNNNNNNNTSSQSVMGLIKPPAAPKILNSAFYPALGLYKPTSTLLSKHFETIRNCGIGVLILTHNGKAIERELYKTIIQLAPKYNLRITFEISVANNQSLAFLKKQLKDLQTFLSMPGFYKVYSLSRNQQMPIIYVSNAYKLIDTPTTRIFCKDHNNNNVLRRILDGLYIGHIRLKTHAESIRRLCFDGYYSKLPSNGATFASTWKNWSYLKSFAMTYKMLFIPTVGPGFAERNKFPRHGDIQRHRSNGRYYGVAWRTAILNHVGFINIASFNNWADGSQIEEVIPKAGYLDYNPGARTKYIDLTTHWVGNFIKNRNETAASANSPVSCYEYINNTIC